MTNAAHHRGATTSVAMATYNGAAFIEAQLRSILSNTVRPDEIVICDDQSSDRTSEIVARVALASPVPIHFHRNPERLRSSRNFERAISLCTGDIIFLSDQDDVWTSDKMERMLAPFVDREIGGVFSDSTLVDEELNPIGSTMFGQLPFGTAHRHKLNSDQAVELIMNRAFVTGAAFAFRRSLVPAMLPIPPSEFFIHDRWLAIVVAAVSRLYVLDEPLILYRQHPGQQLGGPQKWRAHAKSQPREAVHPNATPAGRLRFYRELKAALTEKGRRTIRPQFLMTLEQGIDHLHERTSLPHSPVQRLPLILNELRNGRYAQFSTGWKSAVRDMVRSA